MDFLKSEAAYDVSSLRSARLPKVAICEARKRSMVGLYN